MKRILPVLVITLLLILFVSINVCAAVTVKLGYDFYGYYKTSDNNQTVMSNGCVEIELIHRDETRLEWGVGVEGQADRKIKNTEQTFEFTPVYALINYYLSDNNTSSYFTARLGNDLLNFPSQPYYAVGFGIDFSHRSKVEVVYSTCNGTGKYTRVSILGGITFGK